LTKRIVRMEYPQILTMELIPPPEMTRREWMTATNRMMPIVPTPTAWEHATSADTSEDDTMPLDHTEYEY
jgi:hypothetical protein